MEMEIENPGNRKSPKWSWKTNDLFTFPVYFWITRLAESSKFFFTGTGVPKKVTARILAPACTATVFVLTNKQQQQQPTRVRGYEGTRVRGYVNTRVYSVNLVD